MTGSAHERLVSRLVAYADLLDLDEAPLRAPRELWDAARAELLLLLAELQEPTAAGIAKRHKVAFALAAEMARVSHHSGDPA